MSSDKLVNSNHLYRPAFLNSWDEKELYDLAVWRNGLAFKKTYFSEKGKPIIKIAELKNGLTEQTKYTDDFFDESVHLIKKDMVFSWSGNPETSIDVFWYDLPDGWLNQHIFKIMVKDGTDRKFFYYLLKYLKPNFTAIASNKQTTGLGHVTINDLKNIIVRQPDLNEQRTIVATLSCLDDMIKLNNRTNRILEEMAQAIFKHWFVDFEFPNEYGQTYKSSGGAMVDSELGEIPEGWRVGNFTDMVEVCGGGTPKTRVAKYWNGEIPFFTPKDSSTSYYVIDTEKHLTEAGLENCNSQLYPENTVFITARGTVGKISLSARPMAMNQSCYALKSRNEFNPFFVHQLAINTVNALKYKANGAVFNAIVTRDFNSERVVISPTDCIKRYEIYIKPLYDLMRDNVIENQTLSAMRDTLLPKLMSGEIRVPVEEVG